MAPRPPGRGRARADHRHTGVVPVRDGRATRRFSHSPNSLTRPETRTHKAALARRRGDATAPSDDETAPPDHLLEHTYGSRGLPADRRRGTVFSRPHLGGG